MTVGDAQAIAYHRSYKDNGAEVVAYEIKMLRYCFAHLVPTPPDDVDTRNVFLESYLVHYRALLEFLGATASRDTDLWLLRPGDWTQQPPTRAELDRIHERARPLHRQWFATISQQLSHCTMPRYEQQQSWPIEAMQREMESLLAALEQLAAF